MLLLLLFRVSGGNEALTTFEPIGIRHTVTMGIGSWESTVIKSTDLGILPPLSCGGWDSLLETLDLKPLCLTWPPQKTQLIKTSCLPLYLLESELTTLCHHQLIKDNEESNSPKGFCCSSLAFNIWVFLKFWTRGGH